MNRPAPGKFDRRALDPNLISPSDSQTAPSVSTLAPAWSQLPESCMDVMLEALAVWDESYRQG